MVEEKVTQKSKAKKIDNPVTKRIKKVVKVNKKQSKPKLFEEKANLQNLYLYMIIVDLSVGRTIEKILQNNGSSMQYTHLGRGTAPKEILNIMGVTDNSKVVVNAIVAEDKRNDVEKELEIYFASTKKHRGIAFSIKLSSLEGVMIYKYLTQTM